MIGRMSEPLISVLMPVHNGGEWLAAAVASVLAQDGVALELVVVDDRSPDGAIDRLPASDPRLRIIPVAGAGLVDALNTGLAVVRGHWLARMDADDECLPGRLASQLAYLKQNPEVAIAGCRVEPLGAPTGHADIRVASLPPSPKSSRLQRLGESAGGRRSKTNAAPRPRRQLRRRAAGWASARPSLLRRRSAFAARPGPQRRPRTGALRALGRCALVTRAIAPTAPLR
jgi:glycosyltransferase involved in cell wall biosynthesis